ncbi:MAG: acyl-CoA dehydrogenase family protein [Actinomycetota bacterium]
MDFELSPEINELRKSLASFLEREVRPLEDTLDQEDDHTPFELFQQVRSRSAELGFYAADFPEEFGGAGLPQVGMVALREEAAKSGMRLALAACYGPEGPSGVLLSGTDEQKKKYLMPLISAERSMAFALTEPEAGSDAQNIRTTATQRNGNWVLNGRKHFITNGDHADFVLVFAANDRQLKANGGITAFIVEKGTPGFSLGRSQRGMVDAEGQWELIFEECEVSDEQVLGGPDKVGFGFYSAMQFLAMGRLSIAAMCNGLAEFALGKGLEYAKTRTAFDRPIGKNQYVQGHIIDSLIEHKASRLMTYECAWKYDGGDSVMQESSITKLYASEMVNRVLYRMIQVYGGMGWMREVPLERIARFVRIFTLVEGTSEIQKYIIAKTLGL